jgi:hypothetical protein
MVSLELIDEGRDSLGIVEEAHHRPRLITSILTASQDCGECVGIAVVQRLRRPERKGM